MLRNLESSTNVRTRVIGLFALIALMGLFAFACGSSDDEEAAAAAAAQQRHQPPPRQPPQKKDL